MTIKPHPHDSLAPYDWGAGVYHAKRADELESGRGAFAGPTDVEHTENKWHEIEFHQRQAMIEALFGIAAELGDLRRAEYRR